MKECYIVVHRNYAEGVDACAFYREEDARKSVEADAKNVVASLLQEGYEAKTVCSGTDHIEVSALDGNIYYEWDIVLADIQ